MGIFDRGRSSDELLVVTELTKNAKGESVSKKNLKERKIANKPAFSYLMDGEQPHYILHNRTKGLSYNESGRKDTIQPSDSSWTLGIFTDRRILFLTEPVQETSAGKIRFYEFCVHMAQILSSGNSCMT